MDTGKLEEGMKIKNYKELCELLGEKIKTGNAKVSHLNELKRYVDYKKDGYAFIIQEIYSIPKEKVDARKSISKRGNNSKYSKDIQALVINSLARVSGGSMNYPISQIITNFSIASLNYGAGRKNIDKLSEITKIPIEYTQNFYMIYQAQVRTKIESALNSLRNRALIVWKREVNICVLVAEEEYNELDNIKVEVMGEEGEHALLHYRREYRKATDEEKRYILKAEREALMSLKCETLSQVFVSGKWDLFSNIVKKRLLEYANIVYYYDTYNVVYDKKYIKQANLTRLTVSEKNRTKLNLNNNMGEMFLAHTNKLHERASKKNKLLSFEKIHATEEYPIHAKTFHDIIINNKAKDIRKRINKNKTSVENKKD